MEYLGKISYEEYNYDLVKKKTYLMLGCYKAGRLIFYSTYCETLVCTHDHENTLYDLTIYNVAVSNGLLVFSAIHIDIQKVYQ